MTLLYRSHRGHYEDSIATVREVRDLAHLVEVIREERAGWPDQDEVTAESIGVTPYHGTDARNGWDTHLVTINGRAVGYTNGPLPPQADHRSPGEWQAEMMRRLVALGYAGFSFGPGTRWWPINKVGEKMAGPFISTEAFDAWLTEREQA